MDGSAHIARHFALSNSRREIIISELIQLKEVKYGKKAPFQVIIKKINSHSGKMIKQSIIADLSLDAGISISDHRLYIIDQTNDIKILIKSRFVSQPIHYVIDVESATLEVKKSQQVSKEEFPEIKQKSVFKSDTYQLHWMYMEEIPARYRTPPHQPISSYRRVTRHLVIKDENNHSVLGDTLKFYYQGVLREFSTDFGINLPGFDKYTVIDKEYKLTYYAAP